MWFPLEGSAPHTPPMHMNQEPISVQFYCSLGMLGWKWFDIWRMWTNIAFLSTLLLSSDWGFDYFWQKKKKDRNKLCKCPQRCTKCLYMLLLFHCRRQWFLFSFNVIYESMNINKVLDYKGRELGAAMFFFCSFWTFSLDLFCCHHVKCICVLFSF